MTLAGEEDQLRKPLAGEIQVVVMNGTEVAVTLEMTVVVVIFEVVLKREKGEDPHPEQIGKKVDYFYPILLLLYKSYQRNRECISITKNAGGVYLFLYI